MRLRLIAAVLLVAMIALAARPSAATSGMTIIQHSATVGYFPPWGYVVEQQSQWPDWNNPAPVVNPFPGAVYWDVDDTERWTVSGKLDGGQAYSITKPVMLDNYGHLYKVYAQNGQNRSLRLTISIPEVGFAYSRDFVGGGEF